MIDHISRGMSPPLIAAITVLECVHPPNEYRNRPPQLFRWHLGMVQLLLKGGVRVGLTSKMPTPFHKCFGLESLTWFVQAVGGFFLILM